MALKEEVSQTASVKVSQQPRHVQVPVPRKQVSRTRLFAFIIFGLLAVALIVYFAYQNYRLSTQLKQVQRKATAATAVVDENTKLLEAVGKLIVLPTDEQPTIATVTDLEKLKDQVFFARASIGDKVLIYTKAKKAILYNPASNKIVEVAPLNTQAGIKPSTAPDQATSTVPAVAN